MKQMLQFRFLWILPTIWNFYGFICPTMYVINICFEFWRLNHKMGTLDEQNLKRHNFPPCRKDLGFYKVSPLRQIGESTQSLIPHIPIADSGDLCLLKRIVLFVAIRAFIGFVFKKWTLLQTIFLRESTFPVEVFLWVWPLPLAMFLPE